MVSKVKVTVSGELELGEDDIAVLKTMRVEDVAGTLVTTGKKVTVTVEGLAKKRRLGRGR
jgi:hypothetical protein